VVAKASSSHSVLIEWCCVYRRAVETWIYHIEGLLAIILVTINIYKSFQVNDTRITGLDHRGVAEVLQRAGSEASFFVCETKNMPQTKFVTCDKLLCKLVYCCCPFSEG
jgi:hypothetical protein